MNISQYSCAKWLQKLYLSVNLQKNKTRRSVLTAQTANNHVSCSFLGQGELLSNTEHGELLKTLLIYIMLISALHSLDSTLILLYS